ncbi:MAG: hypothetical protein IKO62_07940 [Bacteroidales bacterium]|nr:hypothetical protein [Bacteroidales bacterium]
MPTLTIRHKRHWFEPRLPHAVFLNGYFVGMLKDDQLRGEVPLGSYALRVQFGGRIPIGKKGKSIDMSLSSTEQVEVFPTGEVICEFHDRERLWNILFDIDLLLWVVSWFVQMPPLYKILSDAFFVIWLVRLVLIRKKYYKIVTKTELNS